MQIVELNIKNETERIEFNSIMPFLYSDNEYSEKQNQYSEFNLITSYILKINEKVMARLALYNSGDNALYFGNFESLDLESGILILEHLKSLIKKKYLTIKLIGPMNGNTWHNYRIAVNNFDSLFKNDITNPSYYPVIFKQCGFEILHRYVSNLQRDFNVQKHELNTDFKIVFFNEIELMARIEEIYNITMQGFKNAPFFMPIPFLIFQNQFKKQLNLINLEISPFIINFQQELCAYSSCYPNNNGDSLIVKTIARKPGRLYAGLGRNLSDMIINMAKTKGYKSIIHAFMHENNSSKMLSEKCEGSNLKNYVLYQWQS